jgi:hypothetical protein
MENTGTGSAKRSQDIYGLIRDAIQSRRHIAATYHNRYRLGRNKEGQFRVLCYQYGGESESGLKEAGSPGNWRCVVPAQLKSVELLEGTWQTASNHSRPASCIVDADLDAEDYPARD